MTGSLFVDTNLLVYFRDASEPQKQAVAERWLRFLWQTRRGRIGFQVLSEFYYTVTRKLDPGLPHEVAREDVAGYLAWQPIPVDAAVMREAWAIQHRYRYNWWDALIIAAARLTDCRYLLTEDLHADQKIDGLRLVDPFAADPASF